MITNFLSGQADRASSARVVRGASEPLNSTAGTVVAPGNTPTISAAIRRPSSSMDALAQTNLRPVGAARDGNAGDVRLIGGGVSELRIDHGPGYRVYFVDRGPALIVVLGCADKDRHVDRLASPAARNASCHPVRVAAVTPSPFPVVDDPTTPPTRP